MAAGDAGVMASVMFSVHAIGLLKAQHGTRRLTQGTLNRLRSKLAEAEAIYCELPPLEELKAP